MKQWQISAFGLDRLELVDVPTPQPAAGEVLVRILASSLNYRDLMTVRGDYNPRMALPRVPLSDGAGEVVAVGDGVTEFKRGDRVAAAFMQNWVDGPPTAAKLKGALGGDLDGMLREYGVFPQHGLVHIPRYLSYEQAAAVPCAGVTAWTALGAAGLIPGQTVLIQGTGGVSIFALQLAKASGARVLGTSSSDEKLARARALGLDAGVNYREVAEWGAWAREQTGGRGVDIVVEVGGPATFGQSLQAACVGGTVTQIGRLAGGDEPLDIRPILMKRLSIRGIYVGSRADAQALLRAMEISELVPVVDEVLPFAKAPEALRAMEQAGHFGKLVLSHE